MNNLEKPVTPRIPYVPTPIAINLLIAAPLLSIGWGLYFRYMVIEYPNMGLACEGGLETYTCMIRDAVIQLFNLGFFGYAALGAVSLALIRPHSLLIGIALVMGGIGLPLYNTGASALSITLVALVLARRVRAKEQEQD